MDKVACDIDRLNIKVEQLELAVGRMSNRILELETAKPDVRDGEALPCPFCGNQPEFREEYRGWIIWCADFLCVEQRYGSATKQDAIDNWNRRQ